MAREFDPYHEWLKIPPSEQPPNHYRLLETARFESDPEIIEAAVSRLVTKLQNLSNGQHVAHAQRILNDVAKARLCLSDPQKKSAYDQQLRQQLGFGGVPGSGSRSTQPKTSPVQRKSTSIAASANVEAAPAKSKPVKSNTAGGKLPAKVRAKNRVDKNPQPKTAVGLLLGYVLLILAVAGAATTYLVIRLSNRPDQSVASLESDADSESDPNDEQLNSTRTSNARHADQRMDQTPVADETAPNQPAAAPQLVTSPSNNQTAAAGDKTDVADASASNPESGSGNPGTQPAPVPTATNTPTPITIPPTSPMPQSVPADGIVYLKPDQLDRFESRLGELAHLEGIPVKVTVSKSEKTRYLRFSDDWNQTIMVYMSAAEVGEELSLENLNAFVGKKIRVHGEIKSEFGSKKIGVWVKAKSQIELVE